MWQVPCCACANLEAWREGLSTPGFRSSPGNSSAARIENPFEVKHSLDVKSMDLGACKNGFQILFYHSVAVVTLGKSFHLLQLQFLHKLNGDNDACLTRLYWSKNKENPSEMLSTKLTLKKPLLLFQLWKHDFCISTDSFRTKCRNPTQVAQQRWKSKDGRELKQTARIAGLRLASQTPAFACC